MATLTVTCTSIKLRGLLKPGQDYFILLQLSQTGNAPTYNTQKLRSEYYHVESSSVQAQRRPDEIRFEKNIFKFENLDPFQIYSLKIGVFEGERAILVGSGSQTIDSEEFELLFDSEDTLKSRMVRLFQVQKAEEIGQAFLEVNLQITSFEYRIFRDSKTVQEHYFDAHCKDQSIIQNHLSHIEDLLKQRSTDLTKAFGTYDKRTEQLSELAVDLAQLRNLKNREASSLEQVKDTVNRLQNVDEIHIEIDILCQTPSGAVQLKERLQKLRLRLELQQQSYDNLTNDFITVKPQLTELKQLILQQQVEEQNAESIKFEISRLKQIKERCIQKKETLLNQEDVIQGLADEVRHRQQQGASQSQIRDQLIELAEKDIMRQQLKKVKLAKQPVYQKTKHDEMLLQKLQQENQELKEKMDDVVREIGGLDRSSTAVQQDSSALDPAMKQKWLSEREQKRVQLKQVESNANNVQRELKHRAKIHASHVSQLKLQLTTIQALMDQHL